MKIVRYNFPQSTQMCSNILLYSLNNPEPKDIYFAINVLCWKKKQKIFTSEKMTLNTIMFSIIIKGMFLIYGNNMLQRHL